MDTSPEKSDPQTLPTNPQLQMEIVKAANTVRSKEASRLVSLEYMANEESDQPPADQVTTHTKTYLALTNSNQLALINNTTAYSKLVSILNTGTSTNHQETHDTNMYKHFIDPYMEYNLANIQQHTAAALSPSQILYGCNKVQMRYNQKISNSH